MLQKVSRCLSIKDCDPPPITSYLISIVAMLILLFLSDMGFYGAMGETFSGDGMRDDPLMFPLIVGYLLASVLFVVSYVYFAMAPRNDETKDNYRNRTTKGSLFGFTIGSLVFVPAVFINSSVMIDFDLTMQIVDAVYHIVQLTIIGIIIAHLLGTPARTEEDQS